MWKIRDVTENVPYKTAFVTDSRQAMKEHELEKLNLLSRRFVLLAQCYET